MIMVVLDMLGGISEYWVVSVGLLVLGYEYL